ncbi:CLUMA_CG008091, isoform A [Clunio marinus]|uniref:CLUMA_CG008091, isoform A n=1 Tax=Clunio marinus TaxID=568069 RepID=A0A1J1I6M0_9DIPT|nr:CLUMA_CG008091, isoform A [Clunio marinus]
MRMMTKISSDNDVHKIFSKFRKQRKEILKILTDNGKFFQEWFLRDTPNRRMSNNSFVLRTSSEIIRLQ